MDNPPIIRRIDDLGRIVIPKQIRNELKLSQNLCIFTIAFSILMWYNLITVKEKRLIIMKFGIYLGRIVKLVDLETGEIVVCGVKPILNWLRAYEGKYTLEFFD